jgi:hypothetical protein
MVQQFKAAGTVTKSSLSQFKSGQSHQGATYADTHFKSVRLDSYFEGILK